MGALGHREKKHGTGEPREKLRKHAMNAPRFSALGA
jgi:hypothetical protein